MHGKTVKPVRQIGYLGKRHSVLVEKVALDFVGVLDPHFSSLKQDVVLFEVLSRSGSVDLLRLVTALIVRLRLNVVHSLVFIQALRSVLFYLYFHV